MTKAELINAMAEKTDVSKAAAKRFLDSFTETVTDTLKGGDKVALVGFGTFSVSERKARKGRNPQTGKEMVIKGTKAPKFKAGKALKDKVA
ncbi:HU family DNA-binding protein [bacterium]|nr:MAG: HU family DNA-binding protein [bacterium]